MTDPDLLIIVPTRERPHNVEPLVTAFATTCRARTELRFCIDGDSPSNVDLYEAAVARTLFRLHREIQDITVAVSVHKDDDRLRLVGRLNHEVDIALKEAVAVGGRIFHRAIGYMGDDHRPQTVGWDQRYLEALAHKPGLVYGNDNVQGEDLPTQVTVSVQVLHALGFMAPPTLTHMYCDNYWRDLGLQAEILTYLPDVVVQHEHPCTGQVEWDASYHESNAPSQYRQDREAYRHWVDRGHLADDVRRVRSYLGLETA